MLDTRVAWLLHARSLRAFVELIMSRELSIESIHDKMHIALIVEVSRSFIILDTKRKQIV